ncbi:MAG: PAS domain S-box protein [Chitinivorax sp.]
MNAAPETDRRYRPALPLLTLLWLWAIAGGHAWLAYTDVEEHAFQRAGSSVSAALAHTRLALDSTERSLQTLAATLAPMLEAPQADLRQMHDLLVQARLTDPSGSLIYVADIEGRVLAWSNAGAVPQAPVAGLDFFRAQLQPGRSSMYLSHLPRSNFAHGVDIPLLAYSLPLLSSESRLRGVLVAYATDQPLRMVYQAFGLTDDGSIRLLRQDGRVLLAEHAAAVVDRQNLHLPALRTDYSHPRRYIGKLGGDLGEHFYALAYLPKYEAAVLAGVERERQLAGWYRQTLLMGVALLLVSALVLAHLYFRRRQLLATVAVHARLADAETKLEGLLSSVPDAVWSSSADRARLRYISPSVTGLFGLSGDLFAASPDSWMQAICESERQEVARAYIETAFGSGQRFERMYRSHGGDGFQWILHRAWGVLDARGNLLSIDNLASDVTAQINSLHALRDREQELQALLDGLPLGALFFKDNHCYANPAARELLGSACNEQMQPTDLFTLLRLSPPSGDLPLDRHGGERRICTLQRIGQPTLFVRVGWRLVARGNLWLLQDVSESERLARLSGEEEAAAEIGGWELDLRTGQVLWSAQMYRLHEQSQGSFVPDRVSVVQAYTLESQARLAATINEAIRTGQSFSLDLDMYLPSGMQRKVHMVGKVQMHEGRAIRLYGSLQDISVRVRTTLALGRQTQLLNAAEQIANMGGWEWSPGGDDILWSQGAQRVLGIPAGAACGMQAWLARAHPDDREAMALVLRQLTHSRRPIEWEYRTLDATLDWRQIEVKTLPELDEHGQIRLVRGTLHDITEARALNQALMLRKRAIEALSSGVLIADLGQDDAPIIYASPAVCEITGYSADELMRNNCRMLQGNDRAQPEIAVIRSAIERREPVQVTLRNYRKDGTMFWNELALAPVPDEAGQIRYYIGIVTDITARRRNDDMLLEMQQRMRSILDTAADAIVVIDQNGIVQLFSHAAENIFGYRAEEVLGRNISMLMPPSIAAGHDSYIRRFVRTGKARVIGFGRELQGLRKDGTLVPIELAVSDWTSGGELFFTGVIRDVTEHRQLQRQLLQSQKLDALGQLAGGVAHDFNNLLGVVVGNLDILATLLETQPTLLKRVNAALHAAERGASLTKRLLSFARTTPAAAETLPVIDLNQATRDISDLLGRPLDPRIEFEVDLATAPLPVRLDSSEFQNALLNLVINARDAMPAGGRLRIATCARAISEAQPDLPAGEYAEISINDSGTGIPDDVREHIFDPFFTTKPKGKGTGLGLPMVYSYVKRMQGAIRLESLLGAGSTFRLLFPSVTDGIDDAAPEPVSHRGNGELILVVDDEVALLDTVADQLEAMGYATLQLSDPQLALRVLRERDDIALLFTDILMPRMSGTELARHARASRPDLPILLYTGFSDRYLDDDLLKQPQVLLLGKPVPRARLTAALQQLLPQGQKQPDLSAPA